MANDIDIFKKSFSKYIFWTLLTHTYLRCKLAWQRTGMYVMGTKGTISGILQKQFKEFKCLENVNNLHEVTTSMVMSRSFCSEKENE